MRRWGIGTTVVAVVAAAAISITVLALSSSADSFTPGEGNAECTALLPGDLGKLAADDAAAQAHEAIAAHEQVNTQLDELAQSEVDIAWSEVLLTADGVRAQGLCAGGDGRWELSRVAVHAGGQVAVGDTLAAAYEELSTL